MSEATPTGTRQRVFGFAGARKAALWGLGILALVIVLGWAGLIIIGRTIFGPPIHAANRDPHLTAIAKSALPLIHNLDRYHREYRHYPRETADIEATLGPKDSMGKFAGWNYIEEPGDAYSLCYRMSWDPSLFYRCTENGTRWEYDPGDGTPSKTLQLQP